jgi:5-methylcytosine-specific restriction endonuclease McrA
MSGNEESDLRAAAKHRGAEVLDRGNGHFQIRGRLLVNYYPLSKKRSAYVAGTTRAETHVSPTQAVAMAFDAPHLAGKPTKRRKSTRFRRRCLIKSKGPNCHWCQALLTLDTSTIDHVIPLSRGGLDNANNIVLACEPCNHARGNAMPEINT